MAELGYAKEIVVKRDPNDVEFIQAVDEVLLLLEKVVGKHLEYIEKGVSEKTVEPERQIIFCVPWVDDSGKSQVNRGFHVGSNFATKLCKDRLCFHSNVSISIIEFLSFGWIFKNSLTGLPVGGGRGGSGFNPEGESDAEIMCFCQSFITELYRYIGLNTDVPAGDIGIGGHEVDYVFGQYKRIRNELTSVLTGEDLNWGGSFVRTQIIDYDLYYFIEAMLQANGISFQGKKVVTGGSGNVAIYATERAAQLGATVTAMSDSSGYTVDEDGVNLNMMKETKEAKRGRTGEYADAVTGMTFHVSENIWNTPCDITLPCVTQNELYKKGAETLTKNGCTTAYEGADMSTTPNIIEVLQANNTLYAPDKTNSVGNAVTSGLETSQNFARLLWTFEGVDVKLKDIMENIFCIVSDTAMEYSLGKNYMAGVSIAGSIKVADSVIDQGIV